MECAECLLTSVNGDFFLSETAALIVGGSIDIRVVSLLTIRKIEEVVIVTSLSHS